MCKSCQYETVDKKVGSKCSCIDKMTVEQYDRFFCDRHAGCPFFKEKEKVAV